MNNSKEVLVVGACGHVGLPLAVVMATAGYKVTGFDIDQAAVRACNDGEAVYKEEGIEPLLQNAVNSDNLQFVCNIPEQNFDVIIIIMGTPIDENLNPDVYPIVQFIKKNKRILRPNQLVILRSTLAPGMTELIRKIIEKDTGLKDGVNFHLVCAPERVLQGKSISEISKLPQLIGCSNDQSFQIAKKFFSRFLKAQCMQLSTVEAELGKLITNMSRYVNFALANEFYIICDTYGANAHKIIDACNHEYDRLNMPKPGANVGGPCLYKDGYFLTENLSFPDLLVTAFKINESIPKYLLNRLLCRSSNLSRIAILGMAFKADCDDVRNSLSYKLKKHILKLGIECIEIDPYLEDNIDELRDVDAIIVMTPHSEFLDGSILDHVLNKDCLVVDMWNIWSMGNDIKVIGELK